MKPVFLMPDEQFVACAGFDALTYCNFLKLAVRMAFWVTIISCLITLPTNWAAGDAIAEQIELQDRINAGLQARAAASNSTEIPTVESECSSPDEPEAAVADAAAVWPPPPPPSLPAHSLPRCAVSYASAPCSSFHLVRGPTVHCWQYRPGCKPLILLLRQWFVTATYNHRRHR